MHFPGGAGKIQQSCWPESNPLHSRSVNLETYLYYENRGLHVFCQTKGEIQRICSDTKLTSVTTSRILIFVESLTLLL